jgi:DNA polymerase I-like protein with 3'-5' exonuclease and polymerase domains
MMLGGIRTDAAARAHRYARLKCDLLDIQDALAELNGGVQLYAKKDLSPIKLKKFLFETLGIPPIRERGKKGEPGKITTKEVALRKMQLRYASRCGNAIQLILDHRRKLKLCSFLDEAKTDDDGIMRCEYAPMTEAGRMASRKNPRNTGGNLQNIDREVRDTFVPDPGHIFLEVDLSQAESRIVYVLSGDDMLYNLACLDPSRFDQHAYNAHMIFGSVKVVPADQVGNYRLARDHDFTPLGYVTKDQRYFGKRTVHGAQRGMRGEKMADELLKEDFIRTPEECQRNIDAYIRKHPGMTDYFQWIRKQVLRSKKLTNSWGRVWDVTYEKMDDDLYRRAYSFLPQSEVADLLNAWGLVPIYNYINAHLPINSARIVAQVHDSVLISCVPEAGYALIEHLHENLTAPRTYASRTGQRTLSMPCEFKIGKTWKGDHTFASLPLPTEYDAAIDALLYNEGADAAVRVATT